MNKMNKIALLFIIIFFNITIKPDSEPPILNKSNQQYSVLRNPIHACRKFVEKSKNSRQFIRDHLKKLKDPKRLLEIGIFTAATVIGLTASVAMHELGHERVFNHFYPNSATIKEIRPWGGGTSFIPLKKICTDKGNFYKERNHLKIAAGTVAGSAIGFLGSYTLHKLLKRHATNHTNFPFLSGLKFAFKLGSLIDIVNLVSINPTSDSKKIRILLTGNHAEIIDLVTKNNLAKTVKWYHLPLDLTTLLALKFFLEPYL